MGSPPQPTEQDREIVEAIHAVFGRHPHTRALHSKGLFCEATFTATAEAAALSEAPHLQGEPVPALVRFSTASGNPDVHDGEREGRGIAVKFQLPGGAVTDLLCVTSPTFLARNPEDFLEMLKARLPDPETGAPDMEKMGAYLGAHPEAIPAIQANLGTEPPASFAQLAYNSLHAFRLIGRDGEGRWVRYRWEPEAGEARIPDDEAKSRPPDYLRIELMERIASDPAGLRLILILGEDGDPTTDPTEPWPESRERLLAGTLELTAIAEDPEADGSVVVFDPTNVVEGIELPEDPVLFARSRAYTISASERAS